MTDLLGDLVQYKDSKDKVTLSLFVFLVFSLTLFRQGTSIAARALIRLFREIHMEILPKNLRGRPKDEDDEDVEVNVTRLIVSFSKLE